MKLSPGDFLDLMDDKDNGKPKTIETVVRFGYVDPSYTTGRPRIIFDIDDSSTIKEYPYLAGYTPAANDRVIVLNNVVLDKII
jgi:hypothetical protein